MQNFPSKRDWWLLLILVVGSAIQVGAGMLLLISPLIWPGLLLFLAAAFIWWTLLTTYYVIEDDTVLIHCGPLHWTIPLKAIDEVAPTRNPLSSPALSLDRLRIRYRRRGKQRAIMISPEDKAGFLHAVAAREPALKIEGQIARRSV